ncbi:MAG TPA: sialate O-acetylesterase [Thermoguttaceae bacterium]|nr:sialate O-acetylesterase [Thermoguttaceae bacterium]
MTLPAPTWADVPAGPVKVFILAGQSNMEGHGKLEWGRDPNYDPETPGAEVPPDVRCSSQDYQGVPQ